MADPEPAENGTAGAFFDVDGTVTRTTIAHYYVDYRTRGMAFPRKWAWLGTFVPLGAYYLLLDQISREEFVRSFYRGYRGEKPDELEAFLSDHFETFTRQRVFPEAERAIREHQAQGRKVFLVSGGLEVRVRPLADHLEVDGVVATRLEVEDGHYTGRIVGRPIVDDEKVNCLQGLAREHGIDLSLSYAYGDSRSDLAFLESVGNPCVVGRRLRRVAHARNWRIEDW